MIKNIDIYLHDDQDLVEKYNKKNVSRDLINYIIGQVTFINKEDKLKIKIYNETNYSNEVCINLIKNEIKSQYHKSLKNKDLNNIKQVILLLVGILFLFISTMVNISIFKEVFLIVGWVPIWEAIDEELFNDTKEKRKRKILKKLIEAEMEC